MVIRFQNQVNLFPWRSRQQAYEQKKLKQVLAISFFLSISMLMTIYVWLNYELQYWSHFLTQIKLEANQNHQLERYINREQRNYLQMTRLIKNYSQYKYSTHLLFLELGRIRTSNICFNDIYRQKRMITFKGVAPSSMDFTDFITHWRANHLFSEIKINSMQEQEDRVVFNFQAIERFSLSS